MKKLILSGILILFSQLNLNAQAVTVETCQDKAKTNYPLIKQYGLIEQTAQYNISNANKGYLPQLSLSVKATYQSEVTSLPITIPGVKVPSLNKDQYQAVLEATQVIWDGGVIASQKKITIANTEVEKQKLKVDLFTLKDRVNQLYFGILLLNEQLKQNDILKLDLETNYNKLTAYKQNGIANQADLDAIKVEQINSNQRESDVKSTRKTYCIMLSALSGLDINDQTELTKPVVDLSIMKETTNNRPELKLFEAQSKLFESQKSLITTGNLPKIGLFAQAGYGRPGLNMLTNAFSDFYIGGLKLSWNISGFYSQKNNLNKLELSKKTVDIQKETFVFNNNLITSQQRNDIEKLHSTLSNDDEIIQLRQNIKKSTSAKLENGTATTSDLIREINAENQSRQSKSLHEIQFLITVYQLKNNINN